MPKDFYGEYQNVELEGVKEIVQMLQNGSADAARMYAQITKDLRKRAEDELLNDQARAQKNLQQELAKLQARGLAKNAQEQFKYAEKAQREARIQGLEEEKRFYESISKESREESEFKLNVLEKENAILILRKQAAEEEEKNTVEGLKAAKQKYKEAAKAEKDLARAQRDREIQKQSSSYQFGEELSKSFDRFRDAMADQNHAQKTMEENLKKTMGKLADGIKAAGNAINQAIDRYASMQTGINARLQSTSSFGQATKKLSSVAFSPLLRAEDLYSNLETLVGLGVVSNVEQRAFFQTVKEGIAQTFDVTNSSMMRMIRLQQNDSTAARLGLEAYLNRFLNVYVENTEYLTSTFDSVADSLFEASALLGKASDTRASLEFEYIVQKWLGSLVGVGMSENAATSIASAIGQLGSGEVDNSMESLLVMAAARANLDYAELLHEGLTARETNTLLKSIVEYLQDLAGYDSNVVKNQLSKIFGVTVSDLVAVTNLSKEAISKIENDVLTYDQMYGELIYQFNELPGRLGISNILQNAFSNFTFQTGMNIGANPALFATWKITDLIQSVTGGINIPYISAMGNGLDLNASVENLIKLGIVGISTLGAIGDIIGGVGSVFNGSTLLDRIGVNQSGAALKTLGGGGLTKVIGAGRTKGVTTSESTYVGNTDADTYKNSALNQAKEEPQEELNQKTANYHDEPVVKYYDEFGFDKIMQGINSGMDSMVKSVDTMATEVRSMKDNVGTISQNSASINNTDNQIYSTLLSNNGYLREIAANTSNGGVLGLLGNAMSGLSSSQSKSSGDVINVLNELKALRAQQLGIYQSQMMKTYYRPGSNASLAEINKIQIQKTYDDMVTGVSTVNATPSAANDYASLSDYLTAIAFADKLTSLTNDVHSIKEKVVSKDNSSLYEIVKPSPIEGFTNINF